MSEPDQLIELLSDGEIHSGTDLGELLGISRVAIKKRIDRLESQGVPIESVSGRGYRLVQGTELFSVAEMTQQVKFDNPNLGLDLQVHQALDSTNSFTGELSKKPLKIYGVLAESQPQGQGRRGRSWVSSAYRNLMLSIGFVYPSWPDNPSGISLAFSVAVHQSLTSLGAKNLCLKWPNDLVAKGKKLGGLLVSASGEAGGEFNLVMGVGINMRMGEALLSDIDQPATDLTELGHSDISRNALAASIISNTADMLDIYPDTGFEPFADYWNKHAVFIGQPVRLFDGDQEHMGELIGVNSQGELCLKISDGSTKHFNKSDLSLRPIS